jgi:hypothetical protein
MSLPPVPSYTTPEEPEKIHDPAQNVPVAMTVVGMYIAVLMTLTLLAMIFTCCNKRFRRIWIYLDLVSDRTVSRTQVVVALVLAFAIPAQIVFTSAFGTLYCNHAPELSGAGLSRFGV